MELKAKPSKVIFSSNRLVTMFMLEGRAYPPDEEILIEPFREYTVSSKFLKQSVEKRFCSSFPGEQLKVSLLFGGNIVHPMTRYYIKGMKLFNAGKFKEALPILLSAAKAKHLEAILQVAYIYEKGLGMWFADSKKAMYWYYQAADTFW